MHASPASKTSPTSGLALKVSRRLVSESDQPSAQTTTSSENADPDSPIARSAGDTEVPAGTEEMIGVWVDSSPTTESPGSAVAECGDGGWLREIMQM